MARLSKIDRLASPIREEIGRLRQDGKTIDQILAKLRELDVVEEISRSGLGRHIQALDKLGEKLRRSRAMAEGIARGLGDKPADEVTRASIELLHDAVFDLLQDATLNEGEDGAEARNLVRNPKAAALIAETLERLVKTSRQNVEFVEKVEARAGARARGEAAKAAETAAKEAGLSGATIETIKRSILGVKAA